MKRAALALAALPALAAAQLSMHPTDAWIREAPPGATILAGYVTLDNPGARPQTCTSAQSALFEGVEIHRTTIEKGMSRMMSAQAIEVPAASHLALAPGGLHFMLVGPLRKLAAGDKVPVTLHCTGGDLAIEFTIRKDEPEPATRGKQG